jgi:malonyl CoA-acyl carrier protein transacylase
MSPTTNGHEMREALLFPGQGSQSADMVEAVERHRPELLDLCRVEVGRDPFDALDGGTQYLQPALYCASIALWAGAGSPLPALVAGHSLGELAALAAAGVFSEADGLRLAAVRGRAMQEAAAAGPEAGMLALLGGEGEEARELAERNGAVVANDNAPGQLVLSGPISRLEAISLDAKRVGLKARRLPVAGGFHSPAMEPAVAPFRRALGGIDLREPRVTVYSGVTARPFEDFARQLVEALTKPVRWRETLLALRDAGAERFVEVGPGKVLRNLAKRTVPDQQSASLAQLEVASA